MFMVTNQAWSLLTAGMQDTGPDAHCCSAYAQLSELSAFNQYRRVCC